MDKNPDLLAESEAVAELAFEQGHELLVIGALALAAHKYVRTTSDIDLAGNVELTGLETFAGILQEKGYGVELRNPEEDLDRIEALCQKYRVPGFQEIRRELNR
ncbi:MAG: hypothetical protein JJU05_00170 [Verrucomicrobia bacterium]|nr:hypothetical protein [Verrucomicrobiota bacterium]MCH8526242.1 hypothetical protein [Kiritimatiellia bacterium]